MKTKIIYLLVIASMLSTLSSCGVFLGPISDLSLQQRMNNGWKKIYEFYEGSTTSYLMSSKLMISKMPNEIRCYYTTGMSPNQYIYYFNTNSFGHMVSAVISTPMPNIMDVTYNKNNNSLIYYNGTYLYHFRDGFNYFWSPIDAFSTGYNMLIVDDETIVGVYSYLSSALAKSAFSNTNVTLLNIPNVNYIFDVAKCRNKFNNDTILYVSYSDSNYISRFQLVSLNNFSFMLNSPMTLADYQPPIIESDGTSRLYMVLSNNIYRYDSGSQSFINESTIPSDFKISSSNTYATAFIGDNLILLCYNETAPENPVSICSYNTSAKSYSIMKFTDIPSSGESVFGLDLYYDPDTYSLYFGIISYGTNATNHGMLFMNQM